MVSRTPPRERREDPMLKVVNLDSAGGARSKIKVQKVIEINDKEDRDVGNSLIEDSDSDNCGTCRKKVKDTDNGIQCEWCQKWFHCGCEKVSNKLYRTMGEEDAAFWCCRGCRRNVRGMKEENKVLRQENKTLRLENEKLRLRISAIEERVDAVKEEIINEVKVEVTRGIQDEIVNRLKQEEEKKKRECNLILYNLRESEKENGIEREAEDKSLCLEIFKEELKFERVEIKKIVRLGRRQERGERRPLLVEVDRPGVKWGLLKVAKALKQATRENHKFVYMAPDLTPEEREKDKKLREDLKKKREEGEIGWYISKGRLVRGNFQ